MTSIPGCNKAARRYAAALTKYLLLLLVALILYCSLLNSFHQHVDLKYKPITDNRNNETMDSNFPFGVFLTSNEKRVSVYGMGQSSDLKLME